MAATSKTHLLNDVYDLLHKHYKVETRSDRPSVLEAVVFGICHEGTSLDRARALFHRLKTEFFDWNEVRVSAVTEIEAVFVGLPDAPARARRVRRFLRQLFERTYGFSLEALVKKPQKEAVKSLQEFEAFQSDYILATVVQQALAGHAIGIDADARRVLDRLHVADAGQDDTSLRTLLERAVPKTRGAEFQELLQALAHDVCVEREPECPRCHLRKICPTGQERLSSGKSPRTASSRASAATGESARSRGLRSGPVSASDKAPTPVDTPAAPPPKAKPAAAAKLAPKPLVPTAAKPAPAPAAKAPVTRAKPAPAPAAKAPVTRAKPGPSPKPAPSPKTPPAGKAPAPRKSR
jgi:endonuclease-3